MLAAHYQLTGRHILKDLNLHQSYDNLKFCQNILLHYFCFIRSHVFFGRLIFYYCVCNPKIQNYST